MLRLRIAGACAALLAALNAANAQDAAPKAPALVSGIEVRFVDAATRPQDDFFRYVNGKWLDSTPIPADKPGFGAFDEVVDRTLEQLRTIVEAAAQDASAPEGSEARKVGDLYRSFADEPRLETLGIEPLRAELQAIAALTDKAQLPAALAHLQEIGVSVPLGPSVHLDNRDSSRYVFDVGQDGLGMPDRDYYLTNEAELKKSRDAYLATIGRTLALAGDGDAAEQAGRILALETTLARANWTKVQNRDPIKTYNKIAIARLHGLAPQFDWNRYLRAAGVDGKVDYLIISQPSYVREFSRILVRFPLATWKSYLRWRLISDYARYLSKAFVDENFAFNGTVLNGVPENEPRWKRGIRLIDASIGEALGRLYVAKYFTPQSKQRADALVRNLLEACRHDIDSLSWMGPQTRAQAQVKLAHFMTKIGYPDKWRDYSKLQIKPDDLVGNVMRANSFEFHRNVDKLGRPVDRAEWSMTPQRVNAYYNPEMNEIVFPAAILQAPFFNAAADDAVNYGAIGAVIGHEISHGFDDQGAQYDENGNLHDWWTKKDLATFRARGKAMVAEYAAFTPVPGFHLNGELTLGENIADNSGLAIAYKAYLLSLGGGEPAILDGYTGFQRFYMGWAQVWREKDRTEYLIKEVKADPHSDARDRVQGAVVNQPGFYEAFEVKPGDRMYLAPDRRVLMW